MEKMLKFVTWVFGGFIVLALVGRLFLYEEWVVPTSDEDAWVAASVAPTLAGGDMVLILTVGTPKAGDLVRCKDPDNPGSFVVGRIAGESGDTVEVKGPTLYVNGNRYDANEACTEPKVYVDHPDTGAEVELRCSRIEFGGTWHFRASRAVTGVADNHRQEVGANKVYLLSDNRTLHLDSRDFGTVDKETCSGRISFRLWGKDGWTDSERRLNFVR